jgi:mannitol/fructose-specific phosphotransferase system IIA component (Ntr-type)
MLLSDIFDRRSIKLNLEGTTKAAVLAELVETIRAAHPGFDSSEILAAINDRESKMSTGITSGVAIPHGCCRGIDTMAGAIGISPGGIEFDALDRKPVHVVFMLVMGEAVRENHLRTLNQIVTLVNSEALAIIRTAKSAQDVHTVLSRFH